MDDLTRLALAAQKGDQDALGAFVRRSQGDVWRFCAALASAGDADDLTQETYLRALSALRRFRADASARTWLLSIARRVVADSVRRAVRDRRLVERIGPPNDSSPGSSGFVDLGLLVDALPDDRREAFVLTQTIGLSYAEAAEVARCPVGTIRSRVARAREQLIEMHAERQRHTG